MDHEQEGAESEAERQRTSPLEGAEVRCQRSPGWVGRLKLTAELDRGKANALPAISPDRSFTLSSSGREGTTDDDIP